MSRCQLSSTPTGYVVGKVDSHFLGLFRGFLLAVILVRNHLMVVVFEQTYVAATSSSSLSSMTFLLPLFLLAGCS